MNVRHYAPFFDDAVYHMWTLLGTPYSRMLSEHGVHTVSAEATTGFVKELVAGDLIVIDGVVSRIGTKSTSFNLRMPPRRYRELHATYDLVEVFFDPESRASTPIPDAVRERLPNISSSPDNPTCLVMPIVARRSWLLPIGGAIDRPARGVGEEPAGFAPGDRCYPGANRAASRER